MKFGLGLRLILDRTSLSKARGALPFLVKGKEALSSVACQLFIQSNPPRSHILPSEERSSPALIYCTVVRQSYRISLYFYIYILPMLKKCTLSLPYLKITYIVVAITSSGISKAKQIPGATFNFDKLGGIDFTKISKLMMCRALEA